MVVRLPFITGAVDEAHKFLLLSDTHLDNPHCNRKLLTQHLEEAKAAGAGILINGDLFCAMQGKGDKRHQKRALSSGQTRDDYINYIIEDAAAFFAPYVSNIVVVGYGNHETALLERMEIDLVELFLDKLQLLTGVRPIRGGYGGWVFFRTNRESGEGTTSSRKTFKLFYHHGSGANNSRTKFNNRAIMHPDANIIWTGHVHKALWEPLSRRRVSDIGREYLDTQDHLVTGTYKDDHETDYLGWADKNEHKAPFLGSWWVNFHWGGAAKRGAWYEIAMAQ